MSVSLNVKNIISTQLYKILIVEDSEFINNAINKTLSELRYLCEQAFDYAGASYKLENNLYDFVVLDLNLPDAYGDELVFNVMRLTKAKIIILTAETDVQSRENFFKNGVLDYIVKDKHFNTSILSIHHTIQGIAQNDTMSVLVIDDSKPIRRHIEKILTVRNYNVLSAENAQEGLDLVQSSDVNMIILDMELPDKHGLDLLRELKNGEHNKIPVIIISGINDPEMVRATLKLGSSDFIKKPFNVEEFVLKVDQAIALNKRDIEILCKQQLFNEYKDAVDRSSIVSKTDSRGVITFVNERFCELSGYTKEELVGKSHNIVRHPDMPSLAFEEMWKTLQEKKPWFGKVKNRKKDGGHYWVNTVINPIVSYDGSVSEYIGIRTDITDLENIKEELETNLDISKKNFSEAYKISQEYQKAIDESNILSRTDTKGIITYVNEQFVTISGYSKEELIGKTHSIVRHPSSPESIYKGMWKTIKSAKTWHGQFKNRAKDGTAYFVDSTIVPILDENEKVVEYLAIRHDVTNLVTFHQEMEDTQKEVIHRIGEVGETRSKETGYHVKRVAEYSRVLALLCGLGKKNADLIYAASPMHDIGKVGIADSILKKPGKLEKDEFEIMKEHALIGYNILKDSKRPILKAAAIVAYRHHEKWDGSGYPNALKGEEIHIFGRITAIADVFDALGSDRVYKKAWELEKIITLFEEEKGKHFDPSLVDIFLKNLDKFLTIRNKFKD